MIHIVTSANRRHYMAQLADMHRLRKRYFVEERGWTDLSVDENGERDAYDDEQTVYFLALGAEGEVQASMRGRPTMDRCMLTDAFPHLIAEGEPPMKGAGVWEVSRICTAPANRAGAQSLGLWRTPDVLLAGMEHASRRGADRLVAVVDLSNFGRMRAACINVRMTGLPQGEAGSTFTGVEIANSPEDIEAFRKAVGRVTWSGYEVDGHDLTTHGSLAAVEAAFQRAAFIPDLAAENPYAKVGKGGRRYTRHV